MKKTRIFLMALLMIVMMSFVSCGDKNADSGLTPGDNSRTEDYDDNNLGDDIEDDVDDIGDDLDRDANDLDDDVDGDRDDLTKDDGNNHDTDPGDVDKNNIDDGAEDKE